MDEKTLKLYKGFAEYIQEHTGLREPDHSKAIELRREVNRCIKNKYDLGSHWQMVAKDLFDRNNVKDERIVIDNKLDKVKFEHDGKEYEVKVMYMDFDVNKFPAESQACVNVTRRDEKEFIISALKRYLSRDKDYDYSKVYLYKSYLLVFTGYEK